MNDKKSDSSRSAQKTKTPGSKNPDPITGAPGSHPVGTGVGAVVGGAAAGAAVGTVAGPIGTIAGAAVGAIAGGLAGKGVAEAVNPTREDTYWRDNHGKQNYARGRAYDDYSAAYRSGYEGYRDYGAKGDFDQNEPLIRKRYEAVPNTLNWDDARPASYAAWQRLSQSGKKSGPGGNDSDQGRDASRNRDMTRSKDEGWNADARTAEDNTTSDEDRSINRGDRPSTPNQFSGSL